MTGLRNRNLCLAAVLLAWTTAQTAVGQQQAMQLKDLPVMRPLPPVDARPLVHLKLLVLEVDFDDVEKIAREYAEAFPEAKIEGGTYHLGKIDSEDHDHLIRALVHKKLAEVISRPQIMTVSGQAADVQVGQQIDLQVASDPDTKKTEQIGLAIHCKPTILDGGKEIGLDLDIEHASLQTEDGEAFVGRKRASYPLKLNDRETYAFEGRSDGKVLMVFVTPTANPHRYPATKMGGAKAVLAATTASTMSMSTVASSLQRIRKVLNELAPDADVDVSLKGNQFEMEALLQSRDQMNAVAKAVSELAGVELQSLRISANQEVKVLSLVGTIGSAGTRAKNTILPNPPVPRPRPVRATQARTSPSPKTVADKGDSETLRQLRMALKELFPKDKIECRELNSSVLLRGTVSGDDRQLVLSIAEDYYPSVINDLKTAEARPRVQPLKIQHPVYPHTAPAPRAVNPLKGDAPKAYSPPPRAPGYSQPTGPSAPKYAAPPRVPQFATPTQKAPKYAVPTPPRVPQFATPAPLRAPKYAVPTPRVPQFQTPPPPKAPKTAVSPPVAGAWNPKPKREIHGERDLHGEIEQLRNEVRGLRDDVRKLIEAIHSRDAKTPKKVSPLTRPASATVTSFGGSRPSLAADEMKEWELTLAEAVSMATNNLPGGLAIVTAFVEPNLGDQIRVSFERLDQSRKTYLAAKRNYANERGAFVGGDVVTVGAALSWARVRSTHQKMLDCESDLRERLGLEGHDGRLIVPVSPVAVPQKG